MKRMIAGLSAAIVAASMSFAAFGAAKVTQVDSGVFVSSIGYTAGSDTYDVGATMGNVDKTFAAGDVINIYLDPSKFSGTDVKFTPETGMSAQELSNAGVEIRTSSSKNADLIQDISFTNQTLNDKKVAYIQVKLVDSFSGAESDPFETTISIYANKVKSQSIKVAGEIKNDSVSVSSGDSYIYLGDGSVAEATDNITQIEVDAGNNISLIARMIKGKQYYAVATTTPTAQDETLMRTDSNIQAIYYLSTNGFDANTKVKISSPETYYVYGADGAYLGTTKEELALSTKYILTAEQTDSFLSDSNTSDSSNAGDSSAPQDGDNNSTAPDIDIDGQAPTDGGTTGGTGTTGSGIPDTGIPASYKFAGAAGVIAIAAIGVIAITTRKKKQ